MSDATTLTQATRPSGRFSSILHPSPAVLLAIGLLNGLLEPLVGAWNEGAMPDLSPLLLLVGVAAVLTLRGRGGLIRPAPVATVLYLIALLLPSSLAAWVATGLYAAWLAWRASKDARVALLLLAGVAATAVWLAQAARAFGAWFMLPDAIAVEHLLRLLRGGVARGGNVIAVAGGHEIIVLIGCATLQQLPVVLLGAVAAPFLVSGQRPSFEALMTRAGLALGLYVPLNMVRLVLLGWSGPSYDLVHGPLGQNVFDGLLIALVLLLPTRGERPVPPAQTQGPAA